MKESWDAYCKYAWGYDFLGPQSQEGINWFGASYTIIDSLDSLIIMGLDDELRKARDWINSSLQLNSKVSLFETVVRCVGGLLTAYEQTGDKVFLDAAKKFGDSLLPAFNTQTGIPRVLINLKTGESDDYSWCKESTILADAGTCQIEFLDLSIHTGDPKYFNAAMKARNSLLLLGPVPPTMIDHDYLFPTREEYSFDAYGDSYFEYLIKLKYFSPSNETNQNEFNLAMQEGISRLGFTSRKTSLNYLARSVNGEMLHEISHLSFFLPGTLYLASLIEHEYKELYLKLANELLDTAVFLYNMQPTGLGGESARFLSHYPNVIWYDDTYKLRPELVESLFYCWRVTHNVKARIQAWKIFESIKKYCDTGSGYSTVKDTSKQVVMYEDVQDSFFLSETLKYLYLIFCDDDTFSLDDYVFTTEAHPLKRVRS
ncbi:Mannosyl-oligosaccharide 1,2-alpha-mannosidase MNS1 [Histomonas meleagridis]|uniref:Mannosyl-oligosaccharide 1,2-alpha-mannosidase MNS1 n=1 Tax=Histomonas meleagridis TaxID=135588 RepID=UPI003559595F|nr:Mannosyl-oligosaccharide 1,2-alpha-mannosidase MNS1 [Histomonas meleagridis]KAH0799987.1 Mannosyl-oligosaccharide 1,2-alpha-mannosidase MNS1 [Histomonas meleagridis]